MVNSEHAIGSFMLYTTFEYRGIHRLRVYLKLPDSVTPIQNLPVNKILRKGYFHLCPRMDFLQTLHINNSLYTNYENVFIEFDS